MDALGALEVDLGVVHDDDLGSGVEEQFGRGAAHSGRAADDQRALAVEAEGIEE